MPTLPPPLGKPCSSFGETAIRWMASRHQIPDIGLHGLSR